MTPAADPLTFYTGTSMPHWLADAAINVPLFVSYDRLCRRKTLPRSTHRWAMDSGMFTYLQRFGDCPVTTAEYAAFIRRAMTEIGNLDWAAPLDWPCTLPVREGGTYGPAGRTVTFTGTGLTKAEHLTRTVAAYLDLLAIDRALPVIPVLQGENVADYEWCRAQLEAAGVDLAAASHLGPGGPPSWWRVGLGSLVPKTTDEARAVAEWASDHGLVTHGFGVKLTGLASFGQELGSADSQGWSARGRNVAGCTASHKSEANCPKFAMAYHRRAVAGVPEYAQGRLALN